MQAPNNAAASSTDDGSSDEDVGELGVRLGLAGDGAVAGDIVLDKAFLLPILLVPTLPLKLTF